MRTKIGQYDEAKRTVEVTFTEGEVVHSRAVNACHDADGAYDAAATKKRVADVGRGVAVKIGLGVIENPPEDVAAEATPLSEEPASQPEPPAAPQSTGEAESVPRNDDSAAPQTGVA